MTIELKNGDCLELMKSLPDKSIDLFICDLPYGETNCKWDSKIDMEEFWKQFKRLRKSKKTACIHFCSTKFGYTLIKSWEKGFKMDMVWKKRNKTGGLASKYRPMRNHEMLYFFYEQAPKYNRDKYHKRILSKVEVLNNVEGNITNAGHPEGAKHFDKQKFFEPPNPVSVLEEDVLDKDKQFYGKGAFDGNVCKKINPSNMVSLYQPKQPTSVIEGAEDPIYGEKKAKRHKRYLKSGTGAHHPPNPASVVEENADSNKVWGYNKPDTFTISKNGTNQLFTPPNPVSVVEEKDTVYSKKGWQDGNGEGFGSAEYLKKMNEKGLTKYFDPPNPVSMFESEKVFIGKRHHQTEKPQDILEFFLKYWTDEGDTVLDPTMGSGSTGVACKKMGRNFIGIELDEKIFKVAESRCLEEDK